MTEFELEDGSQGIMLQLNDITKSVLLETQKALSRSLEVINACVSHELRNPLNYLQSCTIESNFNQDCLERVLDDPDVSSDQLKDKIYSILEKMRTNSHVQESSIEIMKYMVQDLLDYQQINKGKFRKNIRQFNIREAINKILQIQKIKAQDHDVDLKVEYHNIAEDGNCVQLGLESPLIYQDRDRIMQVLLNLLSNALKFTEEGSVTFKVIIDKSQTQSRLIISVTDTGIGIKQ